MKAQIPHRRSSQFPVLRVQYVCSETCACDFNNWRKFSLKKKKKKKKKQVTDTIKWIQLQPVYFFWQLSHNTNVTLNLRFPYLPCPISSIRESQWRMIVWLFKAMQSQMECVLMDRAMTWLGLNPHKGFGILFEKLGKLKRQNFGKTQLTLQLGLFGLTFTVQCASPNKHITQSTWFHTNQIRVKP